jgi:predicted esterase
MTMKNLSTPPGRINLGSNCSKTTTAAMLVCLTLLCGACKERVSSPIERASVDVSSPVAEPSQSAQVMFAHAPEPPEPPIEYAGAAPKGVVVMMHGYNSTHRDFEPVAKLAASEGLAGLSLPAPIVNAPSRYQWERDDLEATHHYVQKALAASFPGVDVPRERVWVAGFSQGGMYAALLVAAYPESYKGGLAIAPAGWASVPQGASVCPEPAQRGEVVVVTGEQEKPAYAEKTAGVVAFLKRCTMLNKVITHPGGHQFPANWPSMFGDVFKAWAS